MRTEIIEAHGSDGVGLRLVFGWHVDRYAHAISVCGRSCAMTLLQSIDESADIDWPASPPLQTLSIEKLADGRRAALLVGMAGGSHWSASIEAVTGQPALVFDLACRHSSRPHWLGSRYLQMSMHAASWLTIESENARVSEGAAVVEIAPEVIAPEQTSRWRYVVSAKPGFGGVTGMPSRTSPTDSDLSLIDFHDSGES